MQPILLTGVVLGLVAAGPKEPRQIEINVRAHYLKAGCEPELVSRQKIVTLEGQRSQVRIGGQVAVPRAGGKVEFVPCGFSLDLTPTGRPNGSIVVRAVAEDSVGPDAKGNRSSRKGEATATVKPGGKFHVGLDVADDKKGGRYEVELEVIPHKPGAVPKELQ